MLYIKVSLTKPYLFIHLNDLIDFRIERLTKKFL